MSSQSSGKFFVGSIVSALLLFLLIKIILSSVNALSESTVATESMTDEAIAERISPVAQTHIGEPPAVVAAPVEGVSGNVGEQVVTQVCALCHSTGMMSSPRLGDAEEWAPRIEKGMDALYSNALNGFNMMPARGGRPDLSDDDVKAAVDHMVSLAK